MSRVPALFRAFPRLSERVSWLALGQFPTPVESHPAVGELDELWIKRDDLSGAAYGGNKVRKLEFLLAEAKAARATRLCTVGGYGSHHVLATALYGKQLGFEVDAAVFPQPITAHVREVVKVDLALGAHLYPARSRLSLPLAIAKVRRLGGFWIAPGGSSVRGSLGYVDGALELVEQIERGELPPPDVIYVALGSCGTVAGLFAGLRGRLRTEIRAVRVVDRLVCNRTVLNRLTAATLKFIGAPSRAQLTDESPTIAIDHRFFGRAYGRPTAEGDEAVADAAKMGIRLETTYTGKAFAALVVDAKSGRLKGKRVLFWNTFSSVDLTSLAEQADLPNWLPLQ